MKRLIEWVMNWPRFRRVPRVGERAAIEVTTNGHQEGVVEYATPAQVVVKVPGDVLVVREATPRRWRWTWGGVRRFV